MRPWPPGRRVHQCGASSRRARAWMHDQEKRPLLQVLINRLTESEIDVHCDRDITSRACGRGDASRNHRRAWTFRGVSDERARLAITSVVEHFNHRGWCRRLAGLVGDLVNADAVACRQVPCVRGAVGVVAVMEESAHAPRAMQPGRRRESFNESGRLIVECAVSSDRDSARCGAFWNAAGAERSESAKAEPAPAEARGRRRVV